MTKNECIERIVPILEKCYSTQLVSIWNEVNLYEPNIYTSLDELYSDCYVNLWSEPALAFAHDVRVSHFKEDDLYFSFNEGKIVSTSNLFDWINISDMAKDMTYMGIICSDTPKEVDDIINECWSD